MHTKLLAQIIFDSYGKLTGAQIKTFLLEKVRVVKHSAMERNYHIFYMLAAGASAEDRKGWAMGDLQTHQFTSQSGCYDRRDGVLDSDLYNELMEAFRVMGFEEEEKASSHSHSQSICCDRCLVHCVGLSSGFHLFGALIHWPDQTRRPCLPAQLWAGRACTHARGCPWELS